MSLVRALGCSPQSCQWSTPGAGTAHPDILAAAVAAPESALQSFRLQNLRE